MRVPLLLQMGEGSTSAFETEEGLFVRRSASGSAGHSRARSSSRFSF